MEKIYLRLETLPVSLNKKLRSHRFKNHRENKAWDLLILSLVNETKKKPSKPFLKAKISIIRHSHRFLDYDGLVGSMKPVVDALVSAEVLSDDSWTVTGAWLVTQRYRPKSEGPLLEILIQEMPAKIN